MIGIDSEFTWLAHRTRISSTTGSSHFVGRWSRRGMSGSSRYRRMVRSGATNEQRPTRYH